MNQITTETKNTGNNSILPATKVTAGLVIPFLLLAFIILFFLPGQTGRYFAWQINPPIMSMFIGAGYLGGAYYFLHVVGGKKWHRVAHGLLPVTAFTWLMLADTIIHWDRFSHAHLGFWLWLILYLVTPILVPWLFFLNRTADPGISDEDDISVPLPVRYFTAIVGVSFLLATILFFLYPSLAISFWPWKLTALTARIMAGWLAIMGVGSTAVALDHRWSGWKIGVESIVLWQALVLVASLLNLSDFSHPLNWYVVATAMGLIGATVIYVIMEINRRKFRLFHL